jgi:hypothetical protein
MQPTNGYRHLLIALLLTQGCAAVWAQTTSAPTPATTSTPAATATAPPAYEDRLIEGGALEPQISTSGTAQTSSDGWPRAYSIGLQGGASTQNGVRTTYSGIHANAQIDTPSYGAFTLDIAGRSNPSSVFGVIENRRLPLNGGWFSSHAAGVVNLQMPSTPRAPSRFYLPGAPLFGATSRWENLRTGLEFAGSVGQPGRFNADAAATGFDRTEGQLATVGAAINRGNVQAGATLFSARDIASNTPAFGAFSESVTMQRADSLHLASAWHAGENFAQAQVFTSRTNSANSTSRATGVWFEAGTQFGAILHEAGAYRFEPNLTWGPLLTASDIQGIHYRASYRTRRWLWDANVEAFDSITGAQSAGQLLALNSRYQYARDIGFGGNLTLRKQNSNAYTAAVFGDVLSRWGNTRAQIDVGQSQTDEQSVRILLDQALANLPSALRVNLGVGIESLHSAGNTERAALLNALVGYETWAGIGLDASVRTRRLINSAGSASTDASLAAHWQINPYWQLSANYVASRGTFTQTANLDPLALPVAASSSNSTSFFVALRYSQQAGRTSAPLGGRSGDAAGRITGVLFLDENGNGKREAGELGAANVTVLLDGRFSARTNAQGAFEFAYVAAGEHRLTVEADNLPLPWFAPDSAIQFTVNARDTTQLDVGAKK